jgi:hypothetical protein
MHKLDPDRPRPYRMPLPGVLLPAAFCSANLIMYWGGFDGAWKLGCAMLLGLALFAFGAWRTRSSALGTLRSAIWMFPWLGGHVVLGALGRYRGGHNILPSWVDIAAVIAFALGIFYFALATTVSAAEAAAAVASDAHQLEALGEPS